MFSFLTDKLYKIYDMIKGISSLDEKSLSIFFSSIKDNLFEADVPQLIIDKIIADIKKRVEGVKIKNNIQPGEYLAREFYLVILNLLQANGNAVHNKNVLPLFIADSKKSKKPFLLLLTGLQGAGKTTTVGKLLYMITKVIPQSIQSDELGVVSIDYERPAAQEQVKIISEGMGVDYISMVEATDACSAAQCLIKAIQEKKINKKIIIVDTAGRLVIDQKMMNELAEVYRIIKPQRVFLVVDSMVSQEGVHIAEAFVKTVPTDGVIVTKVDSEAPGGIILGISTLLTIPVLYVTYGEKYADIRQFDPVTAAKKLLGMGDLAELAKIAEKKIEAADEEAIKESLKKGELSINEFIKIVGIIKNMGPLQHMLSFIPKSFFNGIELKNEHLSAFELFNNKITVLANSMTKKERQNPVLWQNNTQRMNRISQGAGISNEESKKIFEAFFGIRKQLGAMKKFF